MPFTDIDRLVHLADYIASRNFIDIPEITSDYNSTFSNEDDAEPEDIDSDEGFDPYAGCFTYDC